MELDQRSLCNNKWRNRLMGDNIIMHQLLGAMLLALKWSN